MSYVTPAFVGDAKCVTRRHWKPEYAKSFKAGDTLVVMDRQPRFNGRKIGEMELLETPYLENIGVWSGREEQLYRMEGFAFMEDKNIVPEHAPLLKLAHSWVETNDELFVVPFKTTEILPEAKQKYLTDVEIRKARDRLFKALTGQTIADITPPEAYIRG